MKKKIIQVNFTQIERQALFSLMYGRERPMEGTLINLLTKEELPVHRASISCTMKKDGFFSTRPGYYKLEINDQIKKAQKIGKNYINHPFKLIRKLKVFPIRNLPSTGEIVIKENFVELVRYSPLLAAIIGGDPLAVQFEVRTLNNFEVAKVANGCHESLLK